MVTMRPICGFEGRYSVTEDGLVYSHLSGKYLKQKKHSQGYLMVSLVDNRGRINDRLVHRLICTAFRGSPAQNQTDVNHLNCQKTDNRAENLEWCTRSQNMRHAIKNGLMEGQRESVVKSNMERAQAVVGLDKGGAELVRFRSITEARKAGYAQVSSCLLGNRKTAGGLKWERR